MNFTQQKIVLLLLKYEADDVRTHWNTKQWRGTLEHGLTDDLS